LDEGFEETLTLHRLGVFPVLGVSLKTTNCLESLNAQLGQLTDKVDYWRTSDQKQRWVASALLLIEPRLRRIKGYRHLSQLQMGDPTRVRDRHTDRLAQGSRGCYGQHRDRESWGQYGGRFFSRTPEPCHGEGHGARATRETASQFQLIMGLTR
jgi:hypothetical protein